MNQSFKVDGNRNRLDSLRPLFNLNFTSMTHLMICDSSMINDKSMTVHTRVFAQNYLDVTGARQWNVKSV